MLAWVARYLFMGAPDQVVWMMLAGVFHGICYDFFFVTGFMLIVAEVETVTLLVFSPRSECILVIGLQEQI